MNEIYNTECGQISVRQLLTPGGTDSVAKVEILHQKVEIPDPLLESLEELKRGEIYDLDSAFDDSEGS